MNAIVTNQPPVSEFLAALHSAAPAPDRADRRALYGFLVGSWDMDAVLHADDGTARTMRGEIHASWVLAGRALQDVWILPARNVRDGEVPPGGIFHGTTLRIYDPGIDAWHIFWSDPVKQYYPRQVGRPRGNDIVQDGTDNRGDTVRWSFTEITPDSFHWLGERSHDAGARYRLEVEFFARRRPG